MIVGYARVSSKDQNLDRQISALHDAGVEGREAELGFLVMRTVR